VHASIRENPEAEKAEEFEPDRSFPKPKKISYDARKAAAAAKRAGLRKAAGGDDGDDAAEEEEEED
jgi:hypothetical protein